MTIATAQSAPLDTRAAVLALKAAAEPTRLRILALLADGELNVSDLTRILGQSQPRISRHLKLLAEAGLIERFREGSWVFFHLSDSAGTGALAREIVATLDLTDAVLVRDRNRAHDIKTEREAAAQEYFRDHAAEWDRIRALHVAESNVEAAMRAALAPALPNQAPLGLLVDLGTGTGRTLELFADRFQRGLGIDVNNDMLAYARSRLVRAGCGHAQVRHGDIYSLPVEDGGADAVVMHQVLHFLADPARAIREAARIVAPGGRLLIVDFAPHMLEFLRDEFRHVRLGFARAQITQWLADAGLDPVLAEDVTDAERVRHIPDGPERLTVSLWVATRPAVPRPLARATKPMLEPVGGSS
jgi:ubiquinone/menaquinone biosynthesis C-methylase UbiE/DNA-binding transcriptional ArsR family regulator